MHRIDVSVPTDDGALAAWLYRPRTTTNAPTPCILLAHGFTGVRDMQLAPAAERFAEAGLAALVFDYRHFGDSDGRPRQLLDLRRQYADWDAAIAYAQALEGVDRQRIVLWGTSFSGGHVIDAAVRHPDIAAAILQGPFVDGIDQMKRTKKSMIPRLVVDAWRDQIRSWTGRPPHYVPVTCPPGGYAVLASPHVWDSVPVIVPEGSTWRNEVAARLMLRLGTHRPVRHAKRVPCPLLVQVLTNETVLGVRPAQKAAALAPHGELRAYEELDHFEIYVGEGFERLNSDQIDFLDRQGLLRGAPER